MDCKILNTLYKAIIELILLYGSVIQIGATNKKWCIDKLRSVPRLMAITTISAFCTVSTNAALVIAHFLPMDLRAQELPISFFLKNTSHINQKKKARPNHTTIALNIVKEADVHIDECDNFQYSLGIYLPPWKILPFNISFTDKEKSHCFMPVLPEVPHIFTDGSKSRNNVAFYLLILNLFFNQFCGRNSSYVYSYEEEAEAIKSALIFLLNCRYRLMIKLYYTLILNLSLKA